MHTAHRYGVVFDIDGTLLDSRHDIAAAVNIALRLSNFPARSVQEITGYVGDGPRMLLSRSARLSADDAAVPALIRDYLRAHESEPVRYSVPMLGVPEIFSELPVPLAVCTNKTPESARQVLAALGWLEHFARIEAVGGTPYPKPHPDALQRIASSLGLPVQALWFVGDSPQDVECGKRAGAVTVAVANGFNSEASLRRFAPDHLIPDLRALASLIAAKLRRKGL